MSNRALVALFLFFPVLVAFVLGVGFASLDDKANTDTAVAEAVAEAIAAVTPEPTPEPTPIPTPWIITEAPTECIDALEMMAAGSLPSIDFVLAVYDAYLNFPGENLEDFGRRVETLLNDLEVPDGSDEMVRLAAVCRAAS